MGRIGLKRAYETVAPDDGMRVLVDRLWPRGLSKERLAIDLWLKEVAPSAGLRRWFGHDPDKWDEMRERYRRELASGASAEAFGQLRDLCRAGPVTLVFGARDEEHNQAVALKGFLEREGLS